VVYLDFEMRKDYIIKNLCENRFKPQLNCNGQCYLAKKLHKIAEDNATKEPVFRASIKAEATPFGTTTNIDGQFQFEALQKISKITISSIDFQPQTLDYQDNKPLAVSLEPSVENLQ
jgi:CarboxypepD_reg-like domain